MSRSRVLPCDCPHRPEDHDCSGGCLKCACVGGIVVPVAPKKDNMLRIFVKRVGRPPAEQFIPNQVQSMKDLVGGYLEGLQLGSNLTLMCNEDGIGLGLPYNCCVAGHDLRGDIFFTRHDVEGEAIDLTDSDIDKLRELVS